MVSKSDILAVTMMFAYMNPKQSPEHLDTPLKQLRKEYDYIIGKYHVKYSASRTTTRLSIYGEENILNAILGGGSAGSVLANRLSHDPSNRVLLLEAGGVEDSVTDVPMMASVSHHTDIDWSFVSEPQEGCSFALRDQKPVWTQGKVLGGSSVLNFMIYNRGNRRDYDTWAAGGATGWSYDEVLPYFKKSEDNTNASYVANVSALGNSSGSSLP
ncbi:hypothetical protein MTO96_010122 [Rhipicephalus appendiculatus]